MSESVVAGSNVQPRNGLLPLRNLVFGDDERIAVVPLGIH